jgi:outer membrane protein assembly factor BamB
MPAYDRGFSGYNPDAAAPRESVSERWSTELSGLGPSARPVIAAGRVLVPTAGALVGLDLATGDEQWRLGQQQPWASAPVVRDGTAYVGFADQRGLIALDVETGDEQWRIETRGAIKAAPTFDMGRDTLYLGDDTGRLYRITPEDGEVTLRGEVFGPVTALAHGRSLLVGTESGEVYGLFAHHETFTGLWRRKVDGWVTSIAARDGGIFVGTFGGPVYHLQDGADVGSSRWEIEDGSTYLAATGRDVVGSDGGGLRTFDARTGTVGWTREGDYGAAPAIAGDTVYVGGGKKGENGNGFIAAYALSGGTGVGPLTFGGKRWRFTVDSAVMEGVAVADNAVFAVTQSLKESPSRVYALDPD